MSRTTKVAVVINNPVAFRVPVFDRVAQEADIDLRVIYSARKEPGRKSDVPPLSHGHVFLKERYTLRPDGYSVHNNPDVFAALREFDPDVVINNGFQPTNLYAYLYALSHRKAHVPFTDGTFDSERGLSRIHRALRRVVLGTSAAYVGASEGSWRLYAQYGVKRSAFFQSHLCIDNSRFEGEAVERKYDFIFCGRVIPEKRPDFAIAVAQATAARLRRDVSILFVGGGSQESWVRGQVGKVPGVNIHVHGFATQNELPALYRQARIFLFPTVMDTWGVVANEACAAGLPVLVTPYAGVVGELVVDGENGFVHEFDVEVGAGRFADSAARLLSDPALWQQFSERSRQLVAGYTYDIAARGLTRAIRHVSGDNSAIRKKFGRATAVASIPVLLAGMELLDLL